jgi:choline kinase
MFQIEFLINESPKKTNEKITNLINREYMEGSFLFNRKFMRIFFYIFMT